MRRLKNYKPTRFMAETSYYDKYEADFVCTFIEQLKHTKGEFYQQPFELIDWQEQIIRDVFGILKPDGCRQFNTCYIEVPKKCGKSELAAAVALYMLCADGEQRAEVYGCAADREQASLVFDVACDMVKLADDALRRRCEIRPSKKLIRFEKVLEGRVCYGGLDLSSTTDITAFVLVFPPEDMEEPDDKYIVLPYFWVPEETLDLRVRRDHVPYDTWEKQGYMMTTEGNVVHYGFIEKFTEKLGKRFNIREIAFDRWGAAQMVQNLEGMGFTVVPFGQGYKDMSPPTKELMKLVLEKKIAHGGHPVLRWMMDNIFIQTDSAGNIKADKKKSTEKIDGAIATIMGLDRAIKCGNGNTGSVYDERGIISF